MVIEPFLIMVEDGYGKLVAMVVMNHCRGTDSKTAPFRYCFTAPVELFAAMFEGSNSLGKSYDLSFVL